MGRVGDNWGVEGWVGFAADGTEGIANHEQTLTLRRKKKRKKKGGVKCKQPCKERSKGMEVCVDGRCG